MIRNKKRRNNGKRNSTLWMQCLIVHMLILSIQVSVILTGFELGCFPAWAAELTDVNPRMDGDPGENKAGDDRPGENRLSEDSPAEKRPEGLSVEFIPLRNAECVNGFYGAETEFDLHVYYVNHKENEAERSEDGDYVNQIGLVRAQPTRGDGGLVFDQKELLGWSIGQLEENGEGEFKFAYEKLGIRRLKDPLYAVMGDGRDHSLSAGKAVSYLRLTLPRFDETVPSIKNVKLLPGNKSDDGVYCGYCEVQAEAQDEESGITEHAWSTDGENFSELSEIQFFENGTYRLWVRDGVGNLNYEEITVDHVDNTPPEVLELNVRDEGFVNGYGLEGVIEVIAGDAESGLSKKAYSMGEEGEYREENYFTVSENGMVDIAVRDQCQNVMHVRSEVNFIDREGPEIVITGNPSGKVNEDVTLTLRVRDKKAGIAALEYRNDGVMTRSEIGEYDNLDFVREQIPISLNGSYTFYAVDGLGNRSSKTVQITAIDRRKKKSTSTSVYVGEKARHYETPGTEPIRIEGKGSSGSTTSSTKDIVMRSDQGRKKEASSTVFQKIMPEETEMKLHMAGEGDGYLTEEYRMGETEAEPKVDPMEQSGQAEEEIAVTSEGELPKADAQMDIEYPTAVKKSSGSPVFFLAALTVFLILFAVGFLLFKKGIIKLPTDLFEEK